MRTTARRSLEDYLTMHYPFNIIADTDGGYVIEYPDLPGCMTQVESIEEIPHMAEDARRGWITVAYEDGQDIPPPGQPAAYSGKFNLRIPRSLHRALVEGAAREGVSLNQYVTMLLARRDAQAQLERQVSILAAALSANME